MRLSALVYYTTYSGHFQQQSTKKKKKQKKLNKCRHHFDGNCIIFTFHRRKSGGQNIHYVRKQAFAKCHTISFPRTAAAIVPHCVPKKTGIRPGPDARQLVKKVLFDKLFFAY